MLTWFIYDITENKSRNAVSKLAKKYGLYRVQKSVFLGNLDKNKLDEIVLQSEKMLDLDNDMLYVFPMCEKDFKEVIIKGVGFDKDLVADKLNAMIF